MFIFGKKKEAIVLKAIEDRIAKVNSNLEFVVNIIAKDTERSNLHQSLKNAIIQTMSYRSDLCTFIYLHKEEINESLFCSISIYNQAIAGLEELESFKYAMKKKLSPR